MGSYRDTVNHASNIYPIPLLTSPLKGEEPCSPPFQGGVWMGREWMSASHVCPLPFKGRVRVWMGREWMSASHVCPLPFKGRVRVGMGFAMQDRDGGKQ
ncbi:MAG: hypothetical protein A2143_03485 [Gallionellales bacterium RBG_16_57_15]|nr:MAG: hypothetical protein A2143_03485 [Gallionellales bacterium RBG_16_57_15]